MGGRFLGKINSRKHKQNSYFLQINTSIFPKTRLSLSKNQFMQGLVVKNTGSWYEVMDQNRQLTPCKIKGNFRLRGIKTTNPIAIGDRVLFDRDEIHENGLIYEILERRNCIIRKSINLSKQTHILAANIDKAIIITSLFEPRTPQGFIDRFLLTAEAYHIPAIIVFNKVDIYDAASLELLDKYRKMYEDIGCETLVCSAQNGDGIEELKARIMGNICLFSGNSGVGKSSIINAMDSSKHLKTGEISTTHKKGKHTTTFAEMVELFEGTFIIDTPGIKEFGMVAFTKEEVSLFFPEMVKYRAQCQFNNCIHEHEPKCAVKDAVKRGEIHPLRYKSYLNILHGEEI